LLCMCLSAGRPGPGASLLPMMPALAAVLAVLLFLQPPAACATPAQDPQCSGSYLKPSTTGNGNQLCSNGARSCDPIQNFTREACCALCSKTPGCGGWTWGDTVEHDMCWLRKHGTRWRHQPGAWSGTASGPPGPPPPPPPSLSISSVFSSGLVLQRDTPAPIWGWTTATAASVSVTFNSKIYNATSSGPTNRWVVHLDATPATTTPLTLTVTSGVTVITLTDLLIGDVFLCSGCELTCCTLSYNPASQLPPVTALV
jgi:hypothetical protein